MGISLHCGIASRVCILFDYVSRLDVKLHSVLTSSLIEAIKYHTDVKEPTCVAHC